MFRYFFVILLLTGFVSAESTAGVVRIVSIQKILNDSLVGKASRKDLEVEVKKTQLKLEGLKADLGKMQQAYESKAAVLSEDARVKNIKELQNKQQALEISLQESQAELAKKQDDAIGKVVIEVKSILDEIATKEKIDFVLGEADRLVVYATPNLDLTDRVIKILDDRKLNL